MSNAKPNDAAKDSLVPSRASTVLDAMLKLQRSVSRCPQQHIPPFGPKEVKRPLLHAIHYQLEQKVRRGDKCES